MKPSLCSGLPHVPVRSSMTNNEDRFLRALEIQERKRALLEEELEKERKIQELENPTPKN